MEEMPTGSPRTLKSVCLHYLEKCKGKYGNSELAARYLQQLCGEVMSIADEINGNIKTLQHTTAVAAMRQGEWGSFYAQPEEDKPPHLRNLGKPTLLIAKIESLHGTLFLCSQPISPMLCL
jgi:hypothetical protein